MKEYMGKKRNKERKLWIAIGAIAVVLAVLLAVNHELVRVIFHSNWDPKVKLDVSGPWDGGTAYRNLQYADVSETDYLNLYVPESEAPVPLMILVHGGGFVFNDCESRQAQLMYQFFRDHGYACATVNYRLAQEAPFPGAVEDVKAAIRYLRANADRYGYRPDHFVIWGESAGGYLAVMAGVTEDGEFDSLPFIGEEQLDQPISSEVSVILDFYGVAEFQSKEERLAEFRALHIPGFVASLANTWMSDALKDYPEYDSMEDFWLRKHLSALTEEEKREFSPAYYIQKNLDADSDPDVLIWHGDADITVPWTQSQRLYESLCAALGENRTELTYFRNCKHAGERFYSDKSLEALKEYLDGIIGL